MPTSIPIAIAIPMPIPIAIVHFPGVVALPGCGHRPRGALCGENAIDPDCPGCEPTNESCREHVTRCIKTVAIERQMIIMGASGTGNQGFILQISPIMHALGCRLKTSQLFCCRSIALQTKTSGVFREQVCLVFLFGGGFAFGSAGRFSILPGSGVGRRCRRRRRESEMHDHRGSQRFAASCLDSRVAHRCGRAPATGQANGG